MNRYHLIILLTLTLLIGCKESSNLSSSEKNISSQECETQNSSEESEIQNSKIAYTHANFNPNCKESSIFSLYPSLRDVTVQILKYIPSVQGVGESEVSVNIYQQSNPDNAQALNYNEATKSFLVECMPITYHKSTEIYLPFKVEVKDIADGNRSLESFVTLFDSSEQNCKNCHKTNGFENAKPMNGWANADDSDNYKINILKIHDEKYGKKTSQYILHSKLLNYNPQGLEATSKERVINCTDCHHVMALEATGAKKITSLTSGLHKTHLNLVDPYMEKVNSCVTCHPADNIEPLFMGKIMHKRGGEWIKTHKEVTQNIEMDNCKLCHGHDFKGSDLSKVASDFNYKRISYKKGDKVSCLDCHKSIERWDELKGKN